MFVRELEEAKSFLTDEYTTDKVDVKSFSLNSTTSAPSDITQGLDVRDEIHASLVLKPPNSSGKYSFTVYLGVDTGNFSEFFPYIKKHQVRGKTELDISVKEGDYLYFTLDDADATITNNGLEAELLKIKFDTSETTTLTASSTFQASARRIVNSSANLTSETSVSTDHRVIKQSQATLIASSSLNANHGKTTQGSSTITASSTISANQNTKNSSAALSSNTSLTAQHTKKVYSSANLVASTLMNAIGGKTKRNGASIYTSSMISAGNTSKNSSATLTSSSLLNAASTIYPGIESSATLIASSTLNASATTYPGIESSATLISSSTLNASGTLYEQKFASSTDSSQGSGFVDDTDVSIVTA